MFHQLGVVSGFFLRCSDLHQQLIPCELLLLEFLQSVPVALQSATAHGAFLRLPSGTARQYVKLILLSEQLDVQIVAYLFPWQRQQTNFKFTQPSFRRTHKVMDRHLGFPHLLKHFLRWNDAIHAPYAMRLAVLHLYLVQKPSQRRLVARVAVHDFITERKTFRLSVASVKKRLGLYPQSLHDSTDLEHQPF